MQSGRSNTSRRKECLSGRADHDVVMAGRRSTSIHPQPHKSLIWQVRLAGKRSFSGGSAGARPWHVTVRFLPIADIQTETLEHQLQQPGQHGRSTGEFTAGQHQERGRAYPVNLYGAGIGVRMAPRAKRQAYSSARTACSAVDLALACGGAAGGALGVGAQGAACSPEPLSPNPSAPTPPPTPSLKGRGRSAWTVTLPRCNMRAT